MSILKSALLGIALITTINTVTQAQSYTYSSIRKDYVFSDGFGIPHSKTISKSGSVRVNRNELYIDDVMYKMDAQGIYLNAKGKAVDLSYCYNGKKLTAVRLSTGHIINNYILNNASPNAVAQK